MVFRFASGQIYPLLQPDSGAAGGILPKTLIIGFGNPDREDDGVAWHLLDRLAARLDPDDQGMGEESFRAFESRPDLLFLLQLAPDVAETIAGYDRVCFIDAHTGSEPEDITFTSVRPQFQTSPFTHHMTPATCMSLVQALYQREPEAVLVAIRGYSFGFSRSLSEPTLQLAYQAEQLILQWLESDQPTV